MALIPYVETRLQFVVMGHVMVNKLTEVGFSEKFIKMGWGSGGVVGEAQGTPLLS